MDYHLHARSRDIALWQRQIAARKRWTDIMSRAEHVPVSVVIYVVLVATVAAALWFY